MDAQQAFTRFVQRCLSPENARRFNELSTSKKGQRKILADLYHHFDSAFRPGLAQRGGYDRFRDSPCFVFHESIGFGSEFESVTEAYERLSLNDGWLILLRDATVGIYRPEDRWDDEKLIVG